MPEGRPCLRGTPFAACNEKDNALPCSSSCPTPGAHATWGECVRSKGIQIADVDAHIHNTRQNADLKHYVRAREAGLQPASVSRTDVDKALAITEKTGTPFRADQ